MPSHHITVAGAGIIGASIAYHLAKRGAKVTVLEAAQPGAGATGKSFGWINATFSKRPRAYFELNVLGIAGWHRLEEDLQIRIQWGGSVFWTQQTDELRQNVSHHQQWGYATQLIDESELQRLLPACSFPAPGAACYCEHEGVVDPLAATRALLENARKFGAEILYPHEVTELDRTGALVLACGTGSPRLGQNIGLKIPLKESPGVLVHTTPQPRLIDHAVLTPEVHFKQSLDGRIVIGGPVVAGAGTAIAQANVEQAPFIMEQARRYLPPLKDAAIERVTLGYRVMPLDEYPIVGFARDNLYVALTHSGVTLAPVIGELAAQEILDGVQVSALEPYRLSRFNS